MTSSARTFFSDASPVTGVELQGMVLHIMLINNLLIEIIMPGVRLSYGQMGLCAKVRAFLWSFFLMIGSDYFYLDWWLTKIRSITTDRGTELGFLSVANCLDVFLKTLCAAPTLRCATAQRRVRPFVDSRSQKIRTTI
jgi:hypothetical protein